MGIHADCLDIIGTTPNPEFLDIIGIDPAKDSMSWSAYDGASQFDNEVALWTPDLLSADREILPVKSLADRRSRNMTQNDAYIANGTAIQQDSIVGDLYLLNAKPNWKVLGLTEEWADEYQDDVESKFTLWAESPENWVDASRMNTLTSMVRLAIASWGYSGEVLATAEWMRDKVSPYKTAIQMIDTDRLGNPYGQMESSVLRGGVQMNNFGAPIGYHIRNGHPTDINDVNSYTFKYIPATKPWGRRQVIHIIEQLRPGQTRAIAQMVSALKEMKMTKNYRDVVLQSAVVNASFAATVESELPAEAVYAALGAGQTNNMTAWAANYMGAIGDYYGKKTMQMNGTKIPHLFPGTKLEIRNPTSPGGVGSNFEQSLLRYISAALGVSYEQLSHDYSQTNYSSARAAANETEKRMKTKKRLIADRFASHIFRLWLEEAINAGTVKLPPGAPNWYDGQNADAYARCSWTGAGRGQIDELKETQAAILRLKYNLSTHEDEISRLGKDYRETFRQKAREKKMQDDLDIPIIESNAINAASGAPNDGSGGA